MQTTTSDANPYVVPNLVIGGYSQQQQQQGEYGYPSQQPTTTTKGDIPTAFVEIPKWHEFSIGTRIHIGVGLLICVVCFLVWHYTSVNTHTFWWWIYPFFVFSMTLTAQIHYQNGQYWRGFVFVVAILNFMLFVTNGLTSAEFPKWWIYPSGISIMLLLAFHTWRYHEFSVITTAFYEYCTVCVLCFLTWLDEPQTFPWWIIPMFLFAIPLVVVYMKYSYLEKRVWLYVSVSMIIADIMFFLVWGFLPSGFPWFLVLWIVSAGVIILLIWKFGREGSGYSMVQATQRGADPATPQNFTVSVYQ